MKGIDESKIEVGYVKSMKDGGQQTKLVKAILNDLDKSKIYLAKDAVYTPPVVTPYNDDNKNISVSSAIVDAGGNIVPEIETTASASYTVIFNAVDNKGNKAQNPESEKRLTVVIDTEAPKLDYTGDNPIHVNQGAEFEPPTVNATDNEDGEIDVDVIIKDSEGNVVDKVDTNKPGDYTITYEATDEAGNKSEKDVVITVVIDEDKEPPTLQGVPGDQTVNQDDNWTPPNVTATDSQDKEVEVELVITDKDGNVLTPEQAKKPGDYTYTYTAKDDAGNTTTKEFTLTIEPGTTPDTIRPVINGVPEDATIEVGESFIPPKVTGSDNRDGEVEVDVVVTDRYGNVVDGVDTTRPGEYTYTYTAKDEAGNTTTNEFTVTVENDEAPKLDYNGDTDLSTQKDNIFTVPDITIEDDKDDDIEVDVIIKDSEGNVVGKYENVKPGDEIVFDKEGDYTITYEAEDKDGNKSESVTVGVTVTNKPTSSGGGSNGNRPDISNSTEDAIDGLSKEDRDKIAYNLNNWIPYTTLHSNLTLEQLDNLTLNKFTETQLKEILERSEFMDKLGAEENKMSKQITLETIEDVSFSDVVSNHWAKNVINLGAELGIISGMPGGTFEPKTSLKVEDTFTFLDRVLLLNGVLEMDLTRTQVEQYFNDKDHWAFFNVASISSKLTEDTLKTVHKLGNSPVTRELLGQVLYEILNGSPVDAGVSARFTDVSGTKYEEAINYCLEKGLLVGMTETTMEPERAVTRAELIGVLMRLHELLGA